MTDTTCLYWFICFFRWLFYSADTFKPNKHETLKSNQLSTWNKNGKPSSLSLQCLSINAMFTSLDPSYRKGRKGQVQVEILSVLSVGPSSLQHFQYRAFKSSQNHVRPHILYIIGNRRTSATYFEVLLGSLRYFWVLWGTLGHLKVILGTF